MLNPDQRVVIVGAGPCGLGCALELHRLGHGDWLVVERADHAGGLASSVIDAQGFTWDLGGHVVFSHYGEFDALLADVMGDELLHHERSSYVRFADRWVPYPFQNNLHRLPPEIMDECLQGALDAPGGDPAMDFSTWMQAVFGEGIVRSFMRPYNFKVWATPAELMASSWIAERVSVVDRRRLLNTIETGMDDVSWGPNNTFVFPAVGGTGEVYRRIARRLGDRVHFKRDVLRVDAANRIVVFSDGTSESYDALVSTMPLDLLVASLADCPDALRTAALALEHNGIYMVGIGYRSPLRDEKSWMYFPERSVPFYRVTNFAKYAPAHVPNSDTSTYCSYMTETSYSAHKPEPRQGLEQRVDEGLRTAGVLTAEDVEVASMHCEVVPYAYPVPTMGRDAALAVIQPWLEAQAIYSRGRFGTWRYEIGNMDHATKMGIDLARALVSAQREEVYAT
jgi:protoporphyrinogen oxidase